jgi:hypothetical protein
MQTFVPLLTFKESASVLDMRRLGKQRVEVLQIINAITDPSKGWKNHPATKMWQDNVNGLSAYGVAVCREWKSRGYKDTCEEKISLLAEPQIDDLPFWWGDERIHKSHQSNLLKKLPEHYSQFGWNIPDDIPYFWAVN